MWRKPQAKPRVHAGARHSSAPRQDHRITQPSANREGDEIFMRLLWVGAAVSSI